MPELESLTFPMHHDIEQETERLRASRLSLVGYTDELLEMLAQKTLRVNQLKKEKNAVIPAHVYQRPEIIHGVADFVGDSYKLSRLCVESDASTIVFCGVRFMAETAKILNPEKTIILPAVEAGCSLAESISVPDVRGLRSCYPQAKLVCYINTTAEVKAECDVVVTSANAHKILKRLFEQYPQIVFLPDELMGLNLACDLGKKVGEELIIWNGKCVVHENFDPSWVKRYRREYPEAKILAHTECQPDLVALVDFAGGTGDMMRYVEETRAPAYMLITECGLGDLARTKFPDKKFVPMCRLCPYMKATSLDRVEKALREPVGEQIITISKDVSDRARKALHAMFALS